MARLFPISCLLFLSLLAAASAFRITTEMVEVDISRQQGWGQCSPRRQQLRSCAQYLIEGHQQQSRWRESFPQCCNELQYVSEQCRCQAINQIVMQQVQGQLQGVQQKLEMLETARSLPSLCRMSPQYCQNIQVPVPQGGQQQQQQEQGPYVL